MPMPVFVSVDAVTVGAQHVAFVDFVKKTLQSHFGVLANVEELIAAHMIKI